MDTALMVDASTESFLTLTNVTTAATAEPVTPQHKTDAPTPTAAPSKPTSSSGRAKQQDSTEENSGEENSREDEKTQPGKEGLTCFILLFPHSTRFFHAVSFQASYHGSLLLQENQNLFGKVPLLLGSLYGLHIRSKSRDQGAVICLCSTDNSNLAFITRYCVFLIQEPA